MSSPPRLWFRQLPWRRSIYSSGRVYLTGGLLPALCMDSWECALSRSAGSSPFLPKSYRGRRIVKASVPWYADTHPPSMPTLPTSQA